MYDGEYFDRKQNSSIGLQTDRIDQSATFLARVEKYIYIDMIFSSSMGWKLGYL